MFFCCCTGEPVDRHQASFVHAVSATAVEEHQAAASVEGLSARLEEGTKAERSGRDDLGDGDGLAPSKPVEFEAKLGQSARVTHWGWHLDLLQTAAIYICDLMRGSNHAVNVYNAAAPEAERIRAGDYIVSVNGVSGSSFEMSNILQAAQKLELRIQRPAKFSVSLAKGSDKLGMVLKYGTSGTNILIDGITAGAVKERAPEISPGDRLIAVNGVTGSSAMMLEAMQKNDQLCFTMLRLEK